MVWMNKKLTLCDDTSLANRGATERESVPAYSRLCFLWNTFILFYLFLFTVIGIYILEIV